VIIWTYDVAATGDEPAKVKAVITEGGAGEFSRPRHVLPEDDEQAHAEVARELADRPAVQTIHQRLTGFNFRA
jgi:hypothetical protein